MKYIFRLKPFDFIIILLILSASFFITKFTFIPQNQNSSYIEASSPDKTLRFTTNQTAEYSIKGALGDTIFRIENGKIRVLSSPCPGKNCMKHGLSTTVVCLPNKVMINVCNQSASATGEDYDALSR